MESGLLKLLFAVTSSGGTETVTVSAPRTAGVNGANVAIPCPPQLAIDGIVCALMNVSAPVTFKVTGTFVSVRAPLLVTTALMV